MVKEFEGKTEQEAIAKAIDELHIEREDFDVEVVENTRGGLFKKSSVKIRIHFDDDNIAPLPDDITPMGKVAKRALPATDEDGPDLEQAPNPDLENSIIAFVTGILEKMGYPATGQCRLPQGTQTWAEHRQ
jgi:spoIIIJ-associated protein